MAALNLLQRLDAVAVREAANGHWRSTIYPALGIEVGNGKHTACPHCGGKDRFRCDDKDGSGSHFCNQCGAGDGFALVKKINGCDFPEALRIVAGILNIGASTPIDRAALARMRAHREQERLARERQREIEGRRIDRLREADYLVRSARNLDISQWSNDQLDAALDALAGAYELLEQEEACHERS